MSHTVGVTQAQHIDHSGNPKHQAAQRLFLLYHELRSSQTSYSYVTNTSLFEKHLDLYAQLDARNNPLLPEITFDDGHISNLHIAAPALQSRHLTARFFITVGWTGNKPGYMDWNDLRSLHHAGQSIGAHGWTHTLLTHCTNRELEKELSGARTTLEDKLGIAITTMSLPGGRSNSRILNACKQAGYTQVYTSVPKPESQPLGATIGRLNIRGDMQPEWIAQLFTPGSKLLKGIERQYRRKEALKSLLGDRLYAKLWAVANRQESEAAEDPAA